MSGSRQPNRQDPYLLNGWLLSPILRDFFWANDVFNVPSIAGWNQRALRCQRCRLRVNEPFLLLARQTTYEDGPTPGTSAEISRRRVKYSNQDLTNWGVRVRAQRALFFYRGWRGRARCVGVGPWVTDLMTHFDEWQGSEHQLKLISVEICYLGFHVQF